MSNGRFDGTRAVTPCPERIAVIGGGRWARVLTAELCGLVPSSVRISVCSRHNAGSMATWALERGLGQRIRVSKQWPPFDSAAPGAVIVANAARDHEKAVELALSAGIPVLVEKPIALNAAASQRLANLARSRNTRFATAHTFLFARYLENFSRIVAEAGAIRSVRVWWMDPTQESRYGEQKHYDPGLPVLADWLPHVLSMVGALTPGLPQKCTNVTVARGGAHVGLDVDLGGIPCSVQLARNGDRRQRVLEVAAGEDVVRLDFALEPGTITFRSLTIDGDPNWEVERHPVAAMLSAFLRWTAGGEFDTRLDMEIGVRSSQVIDEALDIYRAAMAPWLIARLTSPEEIDGDLRYALSEILLSKSFLPVEAVDKQIARLCRQFSKISDGRRLEGLVQERDISHIFSRISK